MTNDPSCPADENPPDYETLSVFTEQEPDPPPVPYEVVIAAESLPPLNQPQQATLPKGSLIGKA